MHKFERE